MTKDYKQVRKIYFASEHGHNKSYNAYLKRKYNMTLEQYTTLLKSQNNVCAICKNSEVRKANNGKVMKLSVDHNHITGQNRGVLCNKCNLVLGNSDEDIDRLLKTVEYIKKWNSLAEIK